MRNSAHPPTLLHRPVETALLFSRIDILDLSHSRDAPLQINPQSEPE